MVSSCHERSLPLRRYAWQMKGVELVVAGADVDHAIGYYRGAENGTSGSIARKLSTRFGVDGVEIIVRRADVDHAVSHSRRGGDAGIGERRLIGNSVGRRRVELGVVPLLRT